MPANINGKPRTKAAPGIIAAIDVGTTKVCTVVGRRSGAAGIRVLAHSTVPCRGLKKGNVTNMVATQRAIRASVDAVEKATGFHIESAYVGVTGSHVAFENRRGKVDLAGSPRAITSGDLSRLTSTLTSDVEEPGRKLIHAIQMSYKVDGESGIRNPLGMHSRDVEVETHLVTGSVAFINKLVQAVRNAGIRINSLVLEPLASSLAVLTPEEKEHGTVLVDIGGGTTDVVVFRQGRVFYSGVVPVGGYQFTNDIAITFNMAYDAAEAIKLKYAGTDLRAAGANEEVSLPVSGQEVDLKVRRMDISQLARERGQELARLIELKLDGAHLGDPPATRLVLTGGASKLPGLASLLQRSLTLPARHGVPNFPGTIPDELRDPSYATALGILLWAETEHEPELTHADDGGVRAVELGGKGFVNEFLDRLSKVMSVARMATRKGRI